MAEAQASPLLSGYIFDVCGTDAGAKTIVLSHEHLDEVPSVENFAGRDVYVTSDTLRMLKLRHIPLQGARLKVVDTTTIWQEGSFVDNGEVVAIKVDHQTGNVAWASGSTFSFYFKEEGILFVSECTHKCLTHTMLQVARRFKPKIVVLPQPSMGHGITTGDLDEFVAGLGDPTVTVCVATNDDRDSSPAVRYARSHGFVCLRKTVRSIRDRQREQERASPGWGAS